LIKLLLQNAHSLTILGEEVPAINAPFFQSEMASELANAAPYAAAYYFDGSGYKFSLRSREGGKDVSEIASKFGGGGHRSASGFKVIRLSELNTENINVDGKNVES
jgi:nanoRNase/pAp phosphatase (c-di-AMP/oligoRNAs hydrolase)